MIIFNEINNIFRFPSLVKNALSNWFTLAVNLLVGFFLTPYIISYIGEAGYGIYVLILALIGYYGILDLGLSSAIVRFIALYRAQDNVTALKQTISTIIIIFSLLGLLIICLSFFCSNAFVTFFNIPAEKSGEIKLALFLFGLTAGLKFPNNFLFGFLKAYEQFIKINTIETLTTLLRAVLVVILLIWGFGLAGIAAAMLVATILSLIFNYLAYIKLFKEFGLPLTNFNFSILWSMLGYGASSTVIVLADILAFKLDSVVIGKMISLSEVAVFSIAATLVSHMNSVIATSIEVLRPRFVVLDEKEERNATRRLLLKSLFISSVTELRAGYVVDHFRRRFYQPLGWPELLGSGSGIMGSGACLHCWVIPGTGDYARLCPQ